MFHTGADAANSAATGPAKFGFVCKYLKGKTTPSGNLVFFFKADDLLFKGTSMDWLVITGEPRAMFRGEGTINGGPVCKFRVDAWDGSFGSGVDAFRVKIQACVRGDIQNDLRPKKSVQCWLEYNVNSRLMHFNE